MNDHGPGQGPSTDLVVESKARPQGTRDRILAAASELFARRGIRGVGVDAIVSKAGVAKASFYHHFASKNDLIDAWLRSDDARWLDRVVASTEQRAQNPEDQIPAFFDAVIELMDEPDFAGCPYLNVAVELRDPGESTRPVVQEFVAEVRAYFERVAAAAGLPHPKEVAAQLQFLTAGVLTLGVAGGKASPEALRGAVAAIVRAAQPA